MAFTPDELKKEIIKQLNTGSIVPQGHRGAFVIYVDNAGVRTAIAAKMKNDWEIDGEIGWHPHEDGLKIGLNVMKTW